MKKAQLFSRLATLGLALVFLGMTGFTIRAGVITRQATEHARISVHLSDLYEQARYAVGAEESLERLYFLEPGPVAGTEFRAAGASLIQVLQTIQRDGTASDGALARQVIAEQELYHLSSSRMLAAIDAHNSALAHTIDDKQDDPVFRQIEQQVFTAANGHHQQAIQSLAELDMTQNRNFTTAPIVFAIGLLLLGVFWGLLRSYQRNIDKATKAELARLARAALIDNLTDLGNHRAYQEDLHRLLASVSEHGQSVALAIIDIDELKMINEASGHLEGDRVLTTFAAILRHGHLFECIYRLSGDEFAIILPQMTPLEATSAMQQLRQDAEHGLSGATVSIGIASCSLDDCEGEMLQEQAHLAVSEAKRRSHNTLVTFEDIRESVSLIAPAKVHALHRLLSEQCVTIAFQPIWDLQHDRLLAFEALTRPPVDYGFSGPQEAFDIAEKIGRAHELDYLCVHAILARAAELPADALLFLNLTPQTLDHDVLTAAVLLEAERSIVRLDVVVREAKKLRKLGFRLALDDTGAGNAGLEMLSQLPVDFVKIDRSIVVKALTDATARTIFTGITAMARQMNSYVIAEGIEDVAMLNLVQQVGGQAVQGYLLGRPTQVLPSAQELHALSPSAQRASLDRLAAAL